MARCTVQAQHKDRGPPLHHGRRHTHAHTPGMNLGGDKALIERNCRRRRRWTKVCVKMKCACWKQKPEQEPVALYSSRRRGGDRCRRPRGSKQPREEGNEGEAEGFRGALLCCWPSDRWSSGGLSSGTGFNQTKWDRRLRGHGHVLNTWVQEEVFSQQWSYQRSQVPLGGVKTRGPTETNDPSSFCL